MEELMEKLDQETLRVLEDEQINDHSLLELYESHLTSMGITRHGPRLIILGVIQRKKKQIELANRPSTSTGFAPSNASKLSVRELLQSDKLFAQKILYRQLDRQQVPEREHLCWMVRVLCRPWYDTILEEKRYPSVQEKKDLALMILHAFPHLKTTAVEGGSEETGFFYENGGKGSGHEHTGYIQRHIRNLANKVPSELKKYKRRKVPQVEDPEMVRAAEKCAKKEASTANFTFIRDTMVECSKLHLTLIDRKKSANEIMAVFPHFRSYSGKLI
ncbi:uncharacterized protein LOC131682875 isoform X2 [Topomyia yanbarensis]|uniref:uncharacterized protein LOC131682875 isoform X2 n=1 Tax=Topomyia yanbarensis TaxID=2498891 RepID=UPI00273BF9DB|nr:uncharacterized protein LOC131682875 isoform X2 [Topomyia yanbarensis]